MFKRDKSAAALETLIGPTVTVHGDVEFSGGLHLAGRVFGNLRVTGDGDSSLELIDGAVVEGEVRAGRAAIDGRVRGDVFVTGRLALGARAVVEGNVQYGTIEMAAGARITGKMLPCTAASPGPSGGQSLESPPNRSSLQ